MDKEIKNLFKLGAFWNLKYQIPKDPKQMLYDFYTIEFISSYYKEFNNDETQYLISDLKSAAVEKISSKILTDVFLSISAEIRHVGEKSFFNSPVDSKKNLDPKNKSLISTYLHKYKALANEGRDLDERKKINELIRRHGRGVNEQYDLSFFVIQKILNNQNKNSVDFVKACEDAFKNVKWTTNYGGENWGAICSGWIKLKEAKTLEQKITWIDHIVDLQHNTGTVFNKLKSWKKDDVAFAWIEDVLDHKKHATNVMDLVPFTSPVIKQIALRVMKEKEGKTKEKDYNYDSFRRLLGETENELDSNHTKKLISVLRQPERVLNAIFKTEEEKLTFFSKAKNTLGNHYLLGIYLNATIFLLGKERAKQYILLDNKSHFFSPGNIIHSEADKSNPVQYVANVLFLENAKKVLDLGMTTEDAKKAILKNMDQDFLTRVFITSEHKAAYREIISLFPDLKESFEKTIRSESFIHNLFELVLYSGNMVAHHIEEAKKLFDISFLDEGDFFYDILIKSHQKEQILRNYSSFNALAPIKTTIAVRKIIENSISSNNSSSAGDGLTIVLQALNGVSPDLSIFAFKIFMEVNKNLANNNPRYFFFRKLNEIYNSNYINSGDFIKVLNWNKDFIESALNLVLEYVVSRDLDPSEMFEFYWLQYLGFDNNYLNSMIKKFQVKHGIAQQGTIEPYYSDISELKNKPSLMNYEKKSYVTSNIFKLGAFWNFDYKVPNDPRKMLYDFYVIEFISSFYKDFNKEETDHLLDDLKEKSINKMSKRILTDVFLSISAEIRHIGERSTLDLRGNLSESNNKVDPKNKEIISKYYKKFRSILEYDDPREFDMISSLKDRHGRGRNPDYDTSFFAIQRVLPSINKSPLDFVVAAEDVFRNSKWEQSYGGKNWADICRGWIKLKTAKDVSQKITWVDHIIDLQHNTGTVFNKLKSWSKDGTYDWIKEVLEHKKHAKNIMELVPFASPQIKQIALRVVKEKEGQTKEKGYNYDFFKDKTDIENIKNRGDNFRIFDYDRLLEILKYPERVLFGIFNTEESKKVLLDSIAESIQPSSIIYYSDKLIPILGVNPLKDIIKRKSEDHNLLDTFSDSVTAIDSSGNEQTANYDLKTTVIKSIFGLTNDITIKKLVNFDFSREEVFELIVKGTPPKSASRALLSSRYLLNLEKIIKEYPEFLEHVRRMSLEREFSNYIFYQIMHFGSYHLQVDPEGVRRVFNIEEISKSEHFRNEFFMQNNFSIFFEKVNIIRPIFGNDVIDALLVESVNKFINENDDGSARINEQKILNISRNLKFIGSSSTRALIIDNIFKNIINGESYEFIKAETAVRVVHNLFGSSDPMFNTVMEKYSNFIKKSIDVCIEETIKNKQNANYLVPGVLSKWAEEYFGINKEEVAANMLQRIKQNELQNAQKNAIVPSEQENVPVVENHEILKVEDNKPKTSGLEVTNLFKLGAFWNFKYTLPKDPKQMLYDFYVIEFISSYYKDFNKDEIPQLLSEIKESAVKQFKKRILDDVYLAICAEARHVTDSSNFKTIAKQPNSLDRLSIRFNDPNSAKIMKEYHDLYSSLDSNVSLQEKAERFIKRHRRGRSDGYDISYYISALVLKQNGANKEAFIKAAKDSFEKFDWDVSYGGEAWGKICNGWLKLNASKTLHESIIWMDHIIDLQHNTGTVFNKLISWEGKDSGYSWINDVLDHKRNIKEIMELVPFTSPKIKQVALKVLKEKEGKTEQKDTDYSHFLNQINKPLIPKDIDNILNYPKDILNHIAKDEDLLNTFFDKFYSTIQFRHINSFLSRLINLGGLERTKELCKKYISYGANPEVSGGMDTLKETFSQDSSFFSSMMQYLFGRYNITFSATIRNMNFTEEEMTPVFNDYIKTLVYKVPQNVYTRDLFILMFNKNPDIKKIFEKELLKDDCILLESTVRAVGRLANHQKITRDVSDKYFFDHSIIMSHPKLGEVLEKILESVKVEFRVDSGLFLNLSLFFGADYINKVFVDAFSNVSQGGSYYNNCTALLNIINDSKEIESAGSFVHGDVVKLAINTAIDAAKDDIHTGFILLIDGFDNKMLENELFKKEVILRQQDIREIMLNIAKGYISFYDKGVKELVDKQRIAYFKLEKESVLNRIKKCPLVNLLKIDLSSIEQNPVGELNTDIVPPTPVQQQEAIKDKFYSTPKETDGYNYDNKVWDEYDNLQKNSSKAISSVFNISNILDNQINVENNTIYLKKLDNNSVKIAINKLKSIHGNDFDKNLYNLDINGICHKGVSIKSLLKNI